MERERERERERDGSDVIIVALKISMSSHFSLTKIRTLRSASLKWSPWGAEIGNEFTNCVAKNIALFFPPFPIGATNDQMHDCTVLPIEKEESN